MVGMTITAFGFARLLVDIPAGTLSERYGRRTLLWSGPAILAIASFAAALTSSFTWLIVWRFMQGIGSALYMTAAMAAVADLSTPETRGRTMALYQTALLTGTSLGPVVGGFAASLWGYRSPFWIFGIVTSLGAIVAFFGFSETLKKGEGAEENSKKRGHLKDLSDLQLLLNSRNFLLITLVSFAIFFTRTAAKFALIPLVGFERFSMNSDTIGLALTAATLVNFLALPIAGTMMDRYGRKIAIIPAQIACAIALVFFAWATVPIFFWLAMILLGVSMGISSPAAAAYAADVAPQGKFGPAMGLLRAISDLGFMVGPIIVGAVADLTRYGYAGGLLFNAVLVTLLTLLFAWYAQESRLLKPEPLDD
ncbi:MAG: MFS transporter [Elainellaceae cyanobacterium]